MLVSITNNDRGPGPDFSAARRQDARTWQLLEVGKTRDALANCQALNRSAPDFAPGWYSASQLACRHHNFRMALQAIERALALEPGRASWQLQKANCLMRAGLAAEARPLLQSLAGRQLDTGYECATLALLLSRLELHREALGHYRRAASLEPDDAEHHYNQATLHRFLGEVDLAEQCLERALALEPLHGEAHKLRADLRTQSAERNHLAALHAALAAPRVEPRARTYLHYAMAKELEDLQRWPQAFEQLQRGAALRRRHMRYTPGDDLATLQRIADVYDRDTVQAGAGGCDSEQAVFVVGMPRTGTTLVERILGSHSQVYAAGELDAFARCMSRACDALAGGGPMDKLQRVEHSARLDFTALGEAYIESTRPATAGHRRFVDKLPMNFLYAGLIHLALPRARIVHLERHPLDTCFAIYKTLFADAYPFSYDLEELGRYYAAYRRLMAHWQSVLPGVIHTLAYEDLVLDQEGETRRLLAYCDLPWEAQCLEFHRNQQASTTASASQVRQRMYRSSLGRWRQFREQLAPLIRVLEAEGIDPQLDRPA